MICQLCQCVLEKKDVGGVVTLGAIIKGQTKHDEVISTCTAKSLTDLSIKHQKPVTLGISGPGMQERHAYARIRPVAERAVEAVVKISDQLEDSTNDSTQYLENYWLWTLDLNSG